VILKGVERNKSIIPVTKTAWVLWILGRISPNLIMWLMRRILNRGREKGIIVEENSE